MVAQWILSYIKSPASLFPQDNFKRARIDYPLCIIILLFNAVSQWLLSDSLTGRCMIDPNQL